VGGIKMDTKTKLLLLLLISLVTGGCTGLTDNGTEITSVASPNQSEPDAVETISNEKMRVGSFNIEDFGQSKASNPEVMGTLADIIRSYDIIAIQGITDSSGDALNALIDGVNVDSAEHDYVVSEKLGLTSSKKQYAYIYNTKTVELKGETHMYLEPYGTDPFLRQPYIALFRTLNGNFDAVFINVHTDPGDATEEINALDGVVDYAQRLYPGQQDFIIMGDLNADGSCFNEASASDLSGPEYVWVIDNNQDTTTGSADYTYDRFILTDTSDFTGDSGVFRFDDEYGLSYEDTINVADHYPVYADFWNDRDTD
jgi:deoxyribonuclease-1-like protein